MSTPLEQYGDLLRQALDHLLSAEEIIYRSNFVAITLTTPQANMRRRLQPDTTTARRVAARLLHSLKSPSQEQTQ